jgi:hypothetical protein
MWPKWHKRGPQPALSARAKQLRRAQRTFCLKAGTIFVLFAFLIAPLEYHIQWCNYWYQSNPLWEALVNPLPSGLLYFYAVIMAIEALSILTSSPEVNDVQYMFVVRLALYASIVSFFVGYIVSGHYPARWNNHKAIKAPSEGELEWQWITGIWAFGCSVIVHTAAIKFESRKAVR